MSNFTPFHARNHTVVPGVGTIHTQGVADAYLDWQEHTFLAEGADAPVAGRILFGLRIADDGSTHWVMDEVNGPATRRLHWSEPKPTERDQADFPPEAVAEMRRLSETLEERDPTGWFFAVHNRAGDELRRLKRERTRLTDGILHIGKLLADPSEPSQHFVTKAQCGRDKGFFRAATDEERAERRAAWKRGLDRDRVNLETHDREKGARTAMLGVIRSALSVWSGVPDSKQRRLPSTVVAEALAALGAGTSVTSPATA